MKLIRPLFFALSAIAVMAVSALAMPIADLRHLAAPVFAEEAAFSSPHAVDQVTATVASEVMQIVAFALLLLVFVLALAVVLLRARRSVFGRRRRGAAGDFDGGYFDAWRLPDQPPG